MKGFFGAGPGDDFVCETFGMSLAKLAECFNVYVCMKEACKSFLIVVWLGLVFECFHSSRIQEVIKV